MVIVVDRTAGLRPYNGIYYYRLQKSGATITVLTSPIQIATGTEVVKSICTGSNLNGVHWVVSKTDELNEVWALRITTTGVSTVVKTATSPYIRGADSSAIRINQCQNKIFIVGNGHLQVFDWNASTGRHGITALYTRNFGKMLN